MAITKEQLKSKEWRIANLYKIRNKNKQLVTFKPNRAQQHFNENKHTRNLILKSRQLGFTTFESIDSLDDTLWTPNFKCLMISYDVDSAIEIFDDKISLAWENYPEKLKSLYKLDADRANKLKFDFGNNQYSSILVKNRGRSGTYNRAHISEFAKICKESLLKAKEILTGTIPAVPYNGRIDIESTAEGEVGHFHDMFWEAWDRGEPKTPLEFKAHFYNWTWDDEEIANVKQTISTDQMEQGETFKTYQEKHNLSDIQISYYYQKWLSLNKSWQMLRQEYPTTPEEAFISSGNKLFDPDKLALQQQFVKEGEKVGDWTYFEDYQPGHRYAGGADVAEGVGQDSSTIVIWDFTPIKPKVVATYKSNKIAPDLFAYEIKNGGTRYGSCLMAPERNNHGHATIATLKKIYNNIYSEIRSDKKTDERTERLGFQTNLATKPKMMFELNTAINDELVEIPSKAILTEARTYDKEDLDKTRFDEEQTAHWDLLVACAIGFQMKIFAFVFDVTEDDGPGIYSTSYT